MEKFVKSKIFFGGIREFKRKWNLGNLRIFKGIREFEGKWQVVVVVVVLVPVVVGLVIFGVILMVFCIPSSEIENWKNKLKK